ncbi:MAG TPA: stage III sporulation protein AA [Clostridiales bacterium]|nr:stage III sporulation protein AA [Clostridiales bacterium]
MKKRDELLKIFSIKIRKLLAILDIDFELLQEIRLRVNSPLFIIYDNRELFISEAGKITKDIKDAFYISKNEINETMEYISNYSFYAFEEEIRQGFITISGGHRVGISGQVILDNEKIRSMKHISFINIRLSHQVKGCADKVMPHLYSDNKNECLHTLIISPPRCGKTTLLRDIIRRLSNGDETHRGMMVGVVDERSEIGACYMGEPQNDLGIRTDVLDCCPKAKGMMMLVRSMSPRVIAVDEVGSSSDINAIEYVMNCGCRLIATVHGDSIDDIKGKPVLCELVKKKIFERYILLNNKDEVGEIEGIYDVEGVKLF